MYYVSASSCRAVLDRRRCGMHWRRCRGGGPDVAQQGQAEVEGCLGVCGVRPARRSARIVREPADSTARSTCRNRRTHRTPRRPASIWRACWAKTAASKAKVTASSTATVVWTQAALRSGSRRNCLTTAKR